MNPNVPTYEYDPSGGGGYGGYVDPGYEQGGYGAFQYGGSADGGGGYEYEGYEGAEAAGAGGYYGEAAVNPNSIGGGGGGTYFPAGQFQPHVQSGPISALAFDPAASAVYAATHTVSLGRRPPHVGGGVTHGAYIAVHNMADGSLYSANSAHPEAEASVLDAISTAVYGSRSQIGLGADGSTAAASAAAAARRPPPHAYRPPYSSVIDGTMESSYSVRTSHGMGIGAVLPFSSGEVVGDTSYAATVSPSSVRVQTNGCACISAAHHITGMVCGTFNPSPVTSYDGTSLSMPTHITVGGVATDPTLGYNMHCLDLYADLRVVSSHALVADSEISHCVTSIRPNHVTSTLAAGCSDGTLRVFDGKWRKRGNKEVAKVKSHLGGVVSVDISEDGNLICTTGYSARSSFSSAGGAQVSYAFPDQHVLIYDVRYLGRGSIAHSFSGERGGPRLASFIPGDEKNRVLVVSGQSGGGCQICTPYDDLEGTGFAEYIQPELAQGEKITALSLYGRDMVLGTSQSNVILFKMSDSSPTIPATAQLPNADERAPVIPPEYIPPEISLEANILRVGAQDSVSFMNFYTLHAKPQVSSLEGSGHVDPFGPLSSRPLVPSSRRALSDKLAEVVRKQNVNDSHFVVSVKTSDLGVDMLAPEKEIKKRVNRADMVDVNLPNPNRLVFSGDTSGTCYKLPVTQKRATKASGDSKDEDDSIPPRYRLTIRNPSSFMSPSDYIKHNNTGVWPGWDYPPSLPNAWASPIIMLLYFFPEIRSAVLQGQTDQRLVSFPSPGPKKGPNKGKITEPGPAVSAELAYIFYQIEMLSSHALIYPVIEDGPDEPQPRAFSPSNLLTLLTTLPEANQLQILDNAVVPIETARRPEAFYRFLVHHLDGELSIDKSSRKSSTPKLIDATQGFNYQSINEFIDVSAAPTMTSTRTLTVELAYEPFVSAPGGNKKQGDGDGESRARFSDILRYSLCKESRLRAWCKATNDYETIVQRKIATSLPPVLSISCSCSGEKNNEGLQVWRNSADPSKHFLPEIIEIELEESGNVVVRELVRTDNDEGGEEWAISSGKALPKDVVDILHASDRWASPSGERKIRYQLEAVVSFIRTAGDIIDEESESKGHHILHVRVPKTYDETAILKQIEELDMFTEERRSEKNDALSLSSSVPEERLQERSAKASEKLKQLSESGQDSWLLVNGLLCNRWIAADDARAFHADANKEPCLITYRQIESNSSDNDEDKVGTSRLESPQFDIPLSVMNIPSISTGLPPPHRVNDSSDLPGRGDLIAFDAEFVSVQHEDHYLTATGSKMVLREGRSALARMSIIDCRTGRVIIDDHVLPREPVVDYLTRFSGIVEEHLDVNSSPHHLITTRNAYLKLRLLMERGCIFVGHGLRQDFATVNIFVPPSQIVDTVEIFHLPRMRYISLRFLVNYVLKRDMQQVVHDSIEDARAALELYVKALEFKRDGTFDKVLRDIYDFGRKVDWKLGVKISSRNLES